MSLVSAMPICEQATEDLLALSREQLLAMVASLRRALHVQQGTLEEIVDERNAARLLNELCHY